MLTHEGCLARRRRLFESLPEPVDWAVIADAAHQVYFANYCQSPFVFRSAEAAAVLLLARDGTAVLIADNICQPFCDLAHVDEVIAPVWYRGQESAPHRAGFLVKNVLERLSRCPGSRLGVEASRVPAGVVANLKPEQLVDLDPLIRPLRRRKDADEIAILRVSMKAAEAALHAAARDLKPGMTELDAFLLVQDTASRSAGIPVIVYGDFLSGPRCELVSGPATDRRIEKGDLFMLDISPVVWHYRADVCNTFVVGGGPIPARLAELSTICLESLAAGEKALKPGASCQSIDGVVRSHLRKHALERPGHIGHGIGLGHPEPPYIVPQSSDTLMPGDVVTLEPGQYHAGLCGMRFERNYLITDTDVELLSHHQLGLSS